ncbi:RNA-binding protein 10 [Caerostris extrusa]|uniref:RNA-binding protein 10 n=1 Tax=Caerostris extrusa TaxID=172846 RepID=A0AAV4X9D0_CAEEX|nr:RNA-binding protein 10 [Caerostris extrusa]
MPLHVTEEDIRTEVNRFTLYPLDIVLKRKKNTGNSRGFAFVEFRMLSEAVRWKELTQGSVYFGQVRATLHYFSPDRVVPNRTEWTCVKCGLNNFRKRDTCFKCHVPREEGEDVNMNGDGHDEVGSSPSNTLLFRNLDILTTEERVLSMLGQITVLPIKNLKVAKDSLTNTSRGFAYVELHSISEATQLYDLLMNMSGNFFVDGRRVTVNYSRRSLASMNSATSANAASAALAAAQWRNQDLNYEESNRSVFSDSVIQERQMESVQNLNAGYCEGYQNNSIPDVSTYQYDETSGYYYDSITGYYYDPNSQYYYNSETRQYLYWDIEKQTYMVVPTSENNVTAVAIMNETLTMKVEPMTEVVISSPPVIAHAPVLTNKKEVDEKSKEKPNSQEKVKIAKKL